jgi:hypothetical protein
LDSRDLAGKYPPRVLRLNPRPVGLGFPTAGLGPAGDEVLAWGDAVDGGLNAGVGSDDRTRPASSIAACSSALVGSFIGDFVFVAKGDEDADCLPHSALALLTEANVDLSGDGSSFAGETSTFAGDASFNAVGFGLSTLGLVVFVGGVGSARANRDCNGAGDGNGETDLIDCEDCGRGDFCSMSCDPDILLSGSSDAGFFGTPGEDVRGEAMDSGRGDILEML